MSRGLKAIEWVVLIVAALWALMTNITVRNHYKESSEPTIPANTFALVQLLSVGGVLAFRRSPFHLLWLFPLSYLAGFIAVRFRPLAFFSWLYGYLLAYTVPANW